MDRPKTSSHGAAAMPVARRAALHLLLPAAAGESGELVSAAEARRAVPGMSVLWQPPHGCHIGGRPHTYPAADVDDGDRSALSEAQSEPPSTGARDLPIPAAGRLDRTAQSSLEHRYYLCSDAWRLSLPGGGDGLVQPLCAQLGTVQHHGDRLLPGRPGSSVPFRSARDLEFRSGIAVHLGGFPCATEKTRDLHQYGWARPRPGQCLYRAVVAQSQIRADLPRRLCQWRRALSRTGELLPFLQPPTPAPVPELPHTRRPLSTPTHTENVIALMGGSAPQTPRDLSLFSSRVDGFALAVLSDCRTIVGLDRKTGQRRDPTRAPNQARSGWRPSGRLLDSRPHYLRNDEILSKQPGPPQFVAPGMAAVRGSRDHR